MKQKNKPLDWIGARSKLGNELPLDSEDVKAQQGQQKGKNWAMEERKQEGKLSNAGGEALIFICEPVREMGELAMA